MSETISSNWNPMKNHEKYFLVHLNQLNMLLGNHILHILCIFIKSNVWYSWSLKISVNKRCSLFSFTKIIQGHHFVMGKPKNVKLLADISLREAFKKLYYRVYCSLLSRSRRLIKNSKCQQFLFGKGAAKKAHFFILSEGRYLVMGDPIDMNVGVFWETSVGILKSVILHF